MAEARGEDEMYAVQFDTSRYPIDGMVADTTGVLNPFLQSVGINTFKEYKSGRPEGKVLIVGAFQPQQTGNPL